MASATPHPVTSLRATAAKLVFEGERTKPSTTLSPSPAVGTEPDPGAVSCRPGRKVRPQPLSLPPTMAREVSANPFANAF